MHQWSAKPQIIPYLGSTFQNTQRVLISKDFILRQPHIGKTILKVQDKAERNNKRNKTKTYTE